MVKDNDGRAARRARIRQVSVTVGLCSFLVFIYEITLKLQSSESVRETSVINTPGDLSKDIHRILAAEVHLVDLVFSHHDLGDDANSYHGVQGVFCRLEWSKHKTSPSSYPMFWDLQHASPNCKNPIQYDLKEIVRLARIHDENTDNTVSVMSPKGFVFHESRCGSTLAANALAVTHPESTRVYSESGPPISALQSCGLHMSGAKSICSMEQAALLFRDVIYMMGRTNNSEETNLFFKIQSIGTKYIDVFQKAFPTTPWIFVYRDPVHVMMSHLAHGTRNANCVRQLDDIPDSKLHFIQSIGRDVGSLNPEEKCALHLSLLCESALQGLEASQSMGISVSYDHFIDNFIDHVLPDHFGVAVYDAMKKRIADEGKLYSKGRGDRAGMFRGDSKRKENTASDEVKAAALLFLNESFSRLEGSARESYE